MEEGHEILWEPTAAAVEASNLTAFVDHLRAQGVDVTTYPELWQWSVDDLDGFWQSILDYYRVEYDGERGAALGSRAMPGAEWFPGLRLNWAERAFAGKADDQVAILHASELRELDEITWGELRAKVAECAGGLRSLGVEKGDRVVAYVPNIAEATIAFLAVASIGAIWSSASPDFGAGSLIDRFAQIEPKVLIAVDGYRYGGKDFDRTAVVAQLQEAMPSLEHTVLLPYLDPAADAGSGAAELREVIRWDDLLLAGEDAELDLRAGPLRPPPLGPLLVRDDGAAEGDRPGPGRHPPRAAEVDLPPHRTRSPATASSGSRRPAG